MPGSCSQIVPRNVGKIVVALDFEILSETARVQDEVLSDDQVQRESQVGV